MNRNEERKKWKITCQTWNENKFLNNFVTDCYCFLCFSNFTLVPLIFNKCYHHDVHWRIVLTYVEHPFFIPLVLFHSLRNEFDEWRKNWLRETNTYCVLNLITRYEWFLTAFLFLFFLVEKIIFWHLTFLWMVVAD